MHRRPQPPAQGLGDHRGPVPRVLCRFRQCLPLDLLTSGGLEAGRRGVRDPQAKGLFHDGAQAVEVLQSQLHVTAYDVAEHASLTGLRVVVELRAHADGRGGDVLLLQASIPGEADQSLHGPGHLVPGFLHRGPSRGDPEREPGDVRGHFEPGLAGGGDKAAGGLCRDRGRG
ncbi:MAG: hypothetical protein P8080_09255 [Gammaproteobacteria bacterium]